MQLSVFSGDPAPVLESSGAMNTEIFLGEFHKLFDWLNTQTLASVGKQKNHLLLSWLKSADESYRAYSACKSGLGSLSSHSCLR